PGAAADTAPPRVDPCGETAAQTPDRHAHCAAADRPPPDRGTVPTPPAWPPRSGRAVPALAVPGRARTVGRCGEARLEPAHRRAFRQRLRPQSVPTAAQTRPSAAAP